MECTQSQETLSAYVDGELDPSEVARLSAHLEGCHACRTALGELRALRGQIAAEATRHTAPEYLRHRVRAAISAEQQRTAAEAQPRAAAAPKTKPKLKLKPWPWAWINLGLAGLSTTAFTVTLALYLGVPSGEERLEQELVASHFRALMPDHLADVASTDRHTVKPWFAGKLDYSPPVYDLAPQGYALIGGRLDYVNHRPVAAMAYQHRKHIVNLYVWPANDDDARATASLRQPLAASRQGFQLLRWRQGGMEFSAVSELGAPELNEFARLLRERSDGAATQ